MKTKIYLCSDLAQFFLECKLFEIKFVEKIKTHIFFPETVFFFENHTFHEITWKNILEPVRPQMAV